MDVEYISGLRNSLYALVNEQLYSKSNKNYWVCRHPDCKAIIKIVDNNANSEPKHPMHSEVTKLEIESMKVIKLMKVQSVQDEHTDLKVIYDRSIKVLTDQGYKLVDINVHVKSYVQFRGTLVKCRGKEKPTLPHSLRDLRLTGDYLLTNEHTPFLRSDNLNDDNRIIIFMSLYATEWIRSCQSIHGDGTFKECPDMFFQFYVLFGERFNFIVPCCYIVLPNKTTKTYIETLAVIKNIVKPIEDTTLQPMSPVYAMTDFELAMQNALLNQFPSIKLKGCFFHQKQAVQHWVNIKGYKKEMRVNSEFRIWVNMLSTIALVPLHMLADSLEIVENFHVETENDRIPILTYFKKVWINGKFPPETWNYFEHIGRKTNNDVEGFNRYLNKYLNSPHPNIFKFVDHLKTIDANMVLKLTEFKRNPLDYSQYNKPSKQIKEEFQFERLKTSYILCASIL